MRVIGAEFRIEGISDSVNRLTELQETMLQLRSAIRDARAEGDDELLKGLRQSQRGVQEEIKATNAEIRNQVKEINSRQFDNSSIRGLQQTYRELSQTIRELSEEERNSEIGQALIAEAGAIKNEIRDVSESFGDTTFNIGNYTDSIVKAFNQQTKLTDEIARLQDEFNALPESIRNNTEVQEQFNEQIDRLSGQVEQLGEITGRTGRDFRDGFLDELENADGALGEAAKGVRGLGDTFKALLRNPVVAFLALIAGGLAALFNAFKSSEQGVELLDKATGVLNASWSLLVDLSTKVADAITGFADDPLESIKSLGQAIVDNVVNRFEGLINLFSLTGDALRALVNRDFNRLKEVAGEAGTALTQIGTGFDEQQQQAIVESIQETTERISENVSAFVALEQARRASIRTVQELTLEEQRYQNEAQRLACLLYTSPSPRDQRGSRMPSSA